MGHELGAAVGNNKFGRIFISKNDVDIEPSYIFRSDYFIAEKRDGLFTKIIYYDENYIVIFLAGGH